MEHGAWSMVKKACGREQGDGGREQGAGKTIGNMQWAICIRQFATLNGAMERKAKVKAEDRED